MPWRGNNFTLLCRTHWGEGVCLWFDSGIKPCSTLLSDHSTSLCLLFVFFSFSLFFVSYFPSDLFLLPDYGLLRKKSPFPARRRKTVINCRMREDWSSWPPLDSLQMKANQHSQGQLCVEISFALLLNEKQVCWTCEMKVSIDMLARVPPIYASCFPTFQPTQQMAVPSADSVHEGFEESILRYSLWPAAVTTWHHTSCLTWSLLSCNLQDTYRNKRETDSNPEN